MRISTSSRGRLSFGHVRSSVRPSLLSGAIAIALAVAACGGDSSGDGSGDDGRDATDASDDPTDASFTFTAYQGEDRLGGSEVAFDDLLGTGQPVVLNFFAGLCPPCVTEMPWLEAAWQAHGDDVLLVGIDIGPFTGLGTHDDGRKLLDRLDITYPAGFPPDDKPVREFEVTNMPFTVFFDGDGQIIDTHGGMLSEDQIDDWFATLADG